MFRKIAYVLLAAAGVAACDDEAMDPAVGATFVVEVAEETFRVRIENSAAITQARALLSSGQAKNINGEIARGNGGFNTGYSWHLRPASVEFADLTAEVCDGRPSFVEENVDYYVDTVKRYCPWGAKVISEVSPQ